MCPQLERILVFALCLLALGGSVTRGQVVLTVNVSDPTAVTITATGSFAAATTSVSATTFPIQLTGFFGSGVDSLGQVGALGATTTTLQTHDATASLNNALWNRFAPSGGPTTLVLRTGSSSGHNFLTSAAAFTGTATFNFADAQSGLATYLPTAGVTGNVMTSTGTVIGTYQVTASAIPEPSAYAFLGGAVCLTVAIFRRRKGVVTSSTTPRQSPA